MVGGIGSTEDISMGLGGIWTSSGIKLSLNEAKKASQASPFAPGVFMLAVPVEWDVGSA